MSKYKTNDIPWAGFSRKALPTSAREMTNDQPKSDRTHKPQGQRDCDLGKRPIKRLVTHRLGSPLHATDRPSPTSKSLSSFSKTDPLPSSIPDHNPVGILRNPNYGCPAFHGSFSFKTRLTLCSSSWNCSQVGFCSWGSGILRF
jgi:hypothetical protein